jgi:diguanylate cyclase (GGDEF)-like protein/PAS domain S-box-containing protein/putative nucleotidyltransferase with HDIG domain
MRDEDKSKEQLVTELVDLRQSVSDIRESEHGYRDLFECSVDGLAVIDAETLKIVLCNQRAASLYGFNSANDAIGVNPLEFIHPDDRDRTIKHIVDDLFKQDLREPNIFRTLTKDGKDKWISAIGIVIDYHGKKAALASFRDITRSKLTEDALRQSEEKLRLIFDSIEDDITITDLEGRILTMNEAGLRMSGYGRKENIIGRNGFDFIAEKDRAKAIEESAKQLTIKDGYTLSYYTLTDKDGNEFDAEVSAAVLPDINGNPNGFITVVRDITERKRAEEELRKSEERYRLVAENVSDVIWIMDMNARYTYISPSVKRMRGYTAEEMMTLPAHDLVTPESAALILKVLSEELTSEFSDRADPHRVRTLEMESKNKDGSIIWLEVKITFMRDAEGKPIGILGVSRDITERKRIEEALRDSEQKLRLTFESINEAIILTDLEGHILDINEAGIRKSGYGFKSQIIGLNGLQFFEEEARPRVLEQLVKLLREGSIPIISSKIVSRTRRIYDIEASAVLLRDNTGEPTGIIVVIRDVSERKRIEEALRESEEKLRLTFESIEDAIVVIDLDGYMVDLNEATLHIGGYKDKSQVIGRNAFELIAPKDYQIVMDDLKDRIAGRPKQRMEYTIQPEGSKAVDVELTASTIRDNKGNPKQYIAVLRDITERKQAEKQLRESEKKYKELVEREKDVIFSIDESGTITSVNSAVTVWGYNPEEIIGKPYSSFAPAKTVEKLEAELPVQLLTIGEVVAEAMGLDKDGNWRPIEFSATVILKDDKFAGVRGIVRDITERKRAEEALKQRNRELATLNKVAEAVSHPVGLNKVLKTALNSVLETMDFMQGSIWLLDEESKELKLASSRGAKDSQIAVATIRKSLETGKSIAATYYTEGKPAKSNKTPPVNENEGKSIIVVPLKSKGEILGVLGVVGDNQESSYDDMRLLETIGDQIAVAIENAQLVEKLNELSITDELTRLYNRRHFYEVMESEMNRTRRYGRCISLAMIDLDGFKKYNDKFGHASGDVILTDFANALKEGLRRTDTAFRYGGDEFIVILPSTNAERAKEVIERTRKKWLKKLAAQLPVTANPLGFSAGIAQFPENAETVDGLVFLTDTALYYAKRGGKQRVMLISDLGTSSLDVLSSPTLDQIYALAATVDTRDPFTYGHSKRVAAIAESLGRAIGLQGEELSELVAAAFLHDIGKVGVADVILTKPGKPEKEEWEAIKKHCAEGAKIIQHVKELAPLAPYILHHHEWYDGSGYPDKLKGEKIPLSARIISVADAYDTMTAQRPYREAISPQEAMKEMERCSGTQFDPKLIEALRRISHSGLQVN